MQIAVNGTRLWFDVEGPALVPHRASMRERPTVILIHGGGDFLLSKFTGRLLYGDQFLVEIKIHDDSSYAMPVV